MAATHGQLTGRAGVCLSTLGPGALNLATGAAFALLGAMPMIMITGQKGILSRKQARHGRAPSPSRHSQAERPHGFQVDHQLELGGLLYRKVVGLSAGGSGPCQGIRCPSKQEGIRRG